MKVIGLSTLGIKKKMRTDEEDCFIFRDIIQRQGAICAFENHSTGQAGVEVGRCGRCADLH